MNSHPDDDIELVSRLEQIVNRMQDIQRAIKSTHAPASLLELGELKELGLEYNEIVERLKTRQDDDTVAD